MRRWKIVRVVALVLAVPLSALALLMAWAEYLSRPASYTTPLARAAAEGDVARVEELLAAGADINERDRHGRSPLDASLRLDRPNIVKLLLSHGASVQEPQGALSRSLVSEAGANDASLKLLLKAGVDINARVGMVRRTALLDAAADGDLDRVKLLVANGANVNARSGFDRTALHEAARMGELPVVEFLVAHGADVNALSMGQTPGDLALHSVPHPQVAAFLRDHGGRGWIRGQTGARTG